MTSSASPSETELPQSRADSLLHGICIHPATSLPTADPVGAGLPAMASVLSHQWRLCRRHRWQASSHRFCIHPVNLTGTPGPLWELACQRWRPSCHINCACAAVIAGEPAPTGFAFMPQSHGHTWPFVGAGLPAMASFLSHQLRLRRRHRWQASSHRFCIHAAISLPHLALCGSWLASDGVLPVTSIAPAPPSSLASQLPQVLHSCRNLIATPGPLWELACQRWRPSCHINCACAAVIAGKPAPTGFLSSPSNSLAPQLPQGFASTGILSLHPFLLPLRRRFRFVGHPQQSP